MCIVQINLSDGIYFCPIEKALLIPVIRDFIKNRENREYYLKKILESKYDENVRKSILEQLKN